MTKRLGLIGYGGIGQSILAACAAHPLPGYRLSPLLTRPCQRDRAQAAFPDLIVTDSLADFLAAGFDSPHPLQITSSACATSSFADVAQFAWSRLFLASAHAFGRGTGFFDRGRLGVAHI